MPYYLGIDGGGTKTRFLLGDDQTVIAEATSGGSNILRSGETIARQSLHEGIHRVCSLAALPASEIARVVAGIAGSSNDLVRETLVTILREVVACEPVIVGDMVIAHHAALDGDPGILVNAGTGSIAYGRNPQNQTARAGGWGFAISDEGSGHWIGRLAIATAMRCFDTGRDDAFLHHLMAALNVERPELLATFANSTANPDFAQVFPAVLSIAGLGDLTALRILQHAGEELAYLSDAVAERLFSPGDPLRIAAAGGVVRNSSAVVERFCEAVAEKYPSATVSLSTVEPAAGALALARQISSSAATP